jgi:hypothetical protein
MRAASFRIARICGIVSSPECPPPGKSLVNFETIIEERQKCPQKVLRIMGRPVGHTRGPMRPSSPEIVKKLRGELETLGVLDSEPHGWDQ